MAVAPRFGRGLFGWVLFIALAVMLFMLLSKTDTKHPEIPLGDFVRLLKADEVRWVDIGKDTLIGEFDRDERIGQRTIQLFRVNLPEGTTGDWQFTNWLLNNAGNANVGTDSSVGNTIFMNVFLPFLPWLMIFLFIWFFVFRQLRNQAGGKETPPVKVFVVNPAGGENPPLASEVTPEVKPS